jgi:hypothetical protein
VIVAPNHDRPTTIIAVVESRCSAILEVVGHYRYDKLYLSQFFAAEAAWYRLRLMGLGLDWSEVRVSSPSPRN